MRTHLAFPVDIKHRVTPLFICLFWNSLAWMLANSNGIKRGHLGCVRDLVGHVSRHSRGRFVNGGCETLVQEMRNFITSDTGDQIRDLRRNGTTTIHLFHTPANTHSISDIRTGAGGGGIGGRGEFRRVVCMDGWGWVTWVERRSGGGRC